MELFVYITTNLINNKKYIGQHKGSINDNYLGSGTYLKIAIEKYGKENFKREILEICHTEEELNEKEKYWINYYNAIQDRNFYNVAEGGQNWQKGNPIAGFTEEQKEQWKKKISESLKGEKNPFFGKGFHKEEHPMWGKHHTEEAKQKMREKALGRVLSEETKDKIKNNNPNRVIVDVYDLDMNYITTLPSWRDCNRFLNLAPKSTMRIREVSKNNKPYHNYYFIPKGFNKDLK